MAKVTTSYNNFARAKIDHDMSGRFDLPIYNTAADVFENFISNFKGNGIYRSGLESLLAFQDCAMVEFKFNTSQNYIVVLYNLKMRFLSYDSLGNFGWVLDSGLVNPLEITTPYSLAQSKIIAKGRPTQNKDVMVFTHTSHEPRKLIRVDANTFTLTPFARKDDPFNLTFAATKAITAVTQAQFAQVTIVGHGYSVNDRVKVQSIVGMTELNNWTARIVSVVDANNVTIDVDTTTFTAYSSAGTTKKVLTGDYPGNCLFYGGRLYYARTPSKITTIWGSESANYDIFTLPATVTDTSALQFTIADIAQPIEWLFAGDNSLIVGAADGIVAVNGGGVGVPITSDTIDATITSADGCNATYPVRKDGLIFYVGRNNRNLYYFSYDLLTETFKAEDSNIISYDLTLGGFTKIRYKKDRNDLIYAQRGDGDLCTLNFNQKEQITGWHEHNTQGTIQDIASITDNNGDPQFFALVLRGSTYYFERQADYVEFKPRVQFFTDKDSKLDDDAAYNRYVAEQLKNCIYLDGSLAYSDLRTETITYNSGTGRITAGGASFVVGDVGKHISYKTLTGYEEGRFEITAYVSATVVEVFVLQTPTANSYSSWYMSFSSLSGISQFDGTTVGIVTDGGYLDDFAISGGAVDLGAQCNHAVIGYRYKGIIKSFCLGFQFQGKNTQATFKAVSRVGIRTLASAGLMFGTSLYKMEAVQELTQNDLNYLPPIPMDGTKYVVYSDDNEEDKFFYITQDEPLPAQITCVMVEANYAISP